ncbi:MAG: Transcription-repair-coupling factor [Chloroflexi bacterium ADurb.Bin325]|nr:MAG: Transcription-repair-coupling factor [Chloroflexi bacterium ADurb.Bin325]
MKLNGLLDLARDLPALRDLAAELAAGRPPAAALELYRAARPYLVATLARVLDQPLLVITPRSNRARQWVDELRTWLPDEVPVHNFADPDALPYERISWAAETRQRRLEALVSLLTTSDNLARGVRAGPAPIVVSSARALVQMTLPVREMRLALRQIKQGQAFDLNKALTTWVGLGYESEAVVETPGVFSRRGGIVDIWPPNLRKPIRIELFGDEIDSLRTFDPSTQRTLARIEQAWIGPAREALPRLAERSQERLNSLDFAGCHPPAQTEFEKELAQLRAGSGFRNLEWYIPYLYGQPGSLVDYLPGQAAWLIIEDTPELLASFNDLAGQAEQLARDLRAAGDIPATLAAPYFALDALRERLASRPSLSLGAELLDPARGNGHDPAAGDRPGSRLASLFGSGPRYGGQMRTILAELERHLSAGDRVVIVSRQAPRLAELVRETGHAIVPANDILALPPPGLTLVQGMMDEGWKLEPGSWFLTDAELFGWGKPKPRRPQRTRALAPEVFFADVQPGDFVVHMEHGIGKFRGLTKMAVDGIDREYLQIEYAQGDQLYVPVHQADRLARYIGAGETAPHLHRLGTAEWEQVKARAKRAVAEIADDLLELYAQREVVQGHAFSPDATWQHELEASFPYMETEDQLVAIEAVKHDMEQGRPMDRLICGDVGYGKTEVALRAAFKAVMDGKQVAVLVPTTVLAQQHYTNFGRRLAAFPVTVAMLSRFQTPAQQDRVIDGLAAGSVDMVIGTHRLLSQDVAFKDLGLLIVDEEQRFGVAHKERIKQMRTEVDVLTLTATPIPRTLHMSLTGVRDLSTIDTPPEERLPVRTFVGDFDDALVRQAILREMDRNGQVYFVHNRVQGIEQMAARVGKIVPEARIAIAHGQMPEKELSAVMLAFAEGEYDVLVCTSIIESGLDIPNANTIIINRADMFGLAQLYQLRGRVGRSAVRAYAYLLVDRYKLLTEDARRRLDAIQEASDLGAGFRIAMRDLEIRGAGELLGARQHGHIAAVGFDLYMRLLAQAVQESRERLEREGKIANAPADDRTTGAQAHNLIEDPLAPTVTLDLNLPARIPEDYVPESALRLQLYRRLAGLTTLAAVDEIAQEFSDRFGPAPEDVTNLLYIVRVKILAINAGIEAIGLEEGQVLIKNAFLELMDRAALQEQLKAQAIPARVARRAVWLEMREAGAWRRDLIKTLEALRFPQPAG